jgi:hypothetical protein
MAWTDHGVQQVWGLGVPLWQTPFELAGRAIGVTPFPDRVALVAWLALVGALAIRAWVRRDREPWWTGAGSVLITLLLPPVVTLLRGRLGVYEEAALYAYTAAIALLAGTQRVIDAPTRWRLLVLCAAAGAGGLVRPTLWFYGLATLIVVGVSWLRAQRSAAVLALAIALFVAGGGALYATNARRFGGGGEFGHHLNLESLSGNLYATRFSYPFERAGLAEAAIEELGALFDGPEVQGKASLYAPELHRGQSELPRWREYYFSTFSWGYVPILLAGVALGVRALLRRLDPERWLVAWALLAGVPLFVFYLHTPSMSSRYQLDLAPALAALVLIAWRAFAARVRAPIACGVLVAAWLACNVVAKVAPGRQHDTVDQDTAARATYAITHAVAAARQLPAAYDLADPWLPIDNDLLEQFERCTDASGRPVDPHGPPYGGERCLAGERTDDQAQWYVTESQVPERCELVPPSCPEPTVASAAQPIDVTITPPALMLNTFGWDLTTGQVPPATYAWIEDPEFIELDVTTLDGRPADWGRDVQVAIGTTHLRLVSAADIGTAVRLRFEGPVARGLQIAFFAFGPDRELDRERTRFAVRRIAWR